MFQEDFSQPNSSFSSSSSSSWSRLQDQLFERAIVYFPEETPDRWHKISSQVPGKSPLEVKEHYEDLVYDITEIDSGRIELPQYTDDSYVPSWANSDDFRTTQFSFEHKQKQSENERKKGVPWTEEEHKLFLIGLTKYGKGDWRSISRNAVVSRTPTQVASHAQKYYIRLNSMKKDKKRSSIHDITAVDNDSVVTQANDPSWVGSSASSNGGDGGVVVHQGRDSTGPPRSVIDGGTSGYQRFGNFPV